jgi:hypothetical protein
MNCRRHGSKPAFALWMLIAVADVALLASAAGPVVTVLVAGALTTVLAGIAGTRMLASRENVQPARRRGLTTSVMR